MCLKLKTKKRSRSSTYLPVLGLATFAISCLIGKSQHGIVDTLIERTLSWDILRTQLDRAIFNYWLSKVIAELLCFCSTMVYDFPTNQTQNQNQSWLGHTRFPALGVGYVYLLWVLIGLFCCWRLLWLAVVIVIGLICLSFCFCRTWLAVVQFQIIRRRWALEAFKVEKYKTNQLTQSSGHRQSAASFYSVGTDSYHPTQQSNAR